MGEFDYTNDRDEAKVSFPAHKFPYTASVYYECIVKMCHVNDMECKMVSVHCSNDSLRCSIVYTNSNFPQGPDCANPHNRHKREATNRSDDDEGQPATIELYSGLYVNENAEIIENGDDSVFAERVCYSVLPPVTTIL